MTNEVQTQKQIIYPGDTIGIIGEGFGGAQLVVTARTMGFRVVTYTTTEVNDMARYADFGMVGSLKDADKLRSFAERCKIVIYESEKVDLATLNYIGRYTSVPQGTDLLEMAQDRVVEKAALQQMGISVTTHATIVGLDDIYEAIQDMGYPSMLKPILKDPLHEQKMLIERQLDIPKANSLLNHGTYLLEPWDQDSREISITVVKNIDGREKIFPMVENIYQDNHLKETRVPVQLSTDQQNRIVESASRISNNVNYAGIFSVVFYVKKNEITLKRLIPSIHRSHNVFDTATNVSVYEELLRALTGMRMIDIRLIEPSIMLNLNEEQLPQIRTQWLIKDNWHFKFYPRITNKRDPKRIGYVLAEGDNISALQEQIDNTDVW